MAPWPLQQHPSVQLGGDCPPVGPRSRGLEGVMGASRRALPLPWASSAATWDRATRPRRPEVVGGLWDHAGVSLKRPTPSEPPRGCSGRRGQVRDQSRGAPWKLFQTLPARPAEAFSIREPVCSASLASRETKWGRGRRTRLLHLSLLGLCLSPAPQYSSTAPWPPLADLGAGRTPSGCTYLLRQREADVPPDPGDGSGRGVFSPRHPQA